MKHAAYAALALAACMAWAAADAAPGDVYVPAHRTANGLWVPANVPTSSGGTRMTPKLRSAKPSALPPATPSATVSPLLVAAEPIRR